MLLKGEKVVSRFYLMVDTDAPLKSAKINVETCNGLSYSVNPKAYTLFHSPMGAGGYSVRVQKVLPQQHSIIANLKKATSSQPRYFAQDNTLSLTSRERIAE